MLDPSGNEGGGGGGLALGKRSSYFSLAPLGIQECAKNKLQLFSLWLCLCSCQLGMWRETELLGGA